MEIINLPRDWKLNDGVSLGNAVLWDEKNLPVFDWMDITISGQYRPYSPDTLVIDYDYTLNLLKIVAIHCLPGNKYQSLKTISHVYEKNTEGWCEIKCIDSYEQKYEQQKSYKN